MVANGIKFDYDEDAWCLELGFQLGRLEFAFGNRSFDGADLGSEIRRLEESLMVYLRETLAVRGVTLADSYDDFSDLISDVFRKLGNARLTSLILIGVAAFRVSLIGASNDTDKYLTKNFLT